MKGRDEQLDDLWDALVVLEELESPHRVEPTLDAVASALKPLVGLPAELARRS